MTKPMKTFMVALVAIVISSCATIHEQVRAANAVNLSAVKIGMTKAEVQTALNKQPDNTVAAEHDPENNVIEVVQYSQWGTAGTGVNSNAIRVDSYWLYFVNDKLDRWHQIRPGDKRPMDYRRDGQ